MSNNKGKQVLFRNLLCFLCVTFPLLLFYTVLYLVSPDEPFAGKIIFPILLVLSFILIVYFMVKSLLYAEIKDRIQVNRNYRKRRREEKKRRKGTRSPSTWKLRRVFARYNHAYSKAIDKYSSIAYPRPPKKSKRSQKTKPYRDNLPSMIEIADSDKSNKEIFDIWKKKFNITRKMYDYGMDFSEDFGNIGTPQLPLLTEKEMRKIEEDLLIITKSDFSEELDSDNQIKLLIDNVRNNKDDNTRYLSLLQLIAKDIDSQTQENDFKIVKEQLLAFLKEDKSVLNRLKLFIQLKMNLIEIEGDSLVDDIYDEIFSTDWYLEKILEEIISTKALSEFSQNELTNITSLIFCLWETIFQEGYVYSSDGCLLSIDEDIRNMVRLFSLIYR